MERKCKHCGAWNKEETHCQSCGTTISPELMREEEIINNEHKTLLKPKGKIDLFFLKMKNSPHLSVRITFKILNIFWIVYLAIISFILWFVALGPG